MVDEFAIPCADDITSAVDRLLKVHYAFNLQYPAALYNFFTFLELAVFKLERGKQNLPATVLELESSIDALIQQVA